MKKATLNKAIKETKAFKEFKKESTMKTINEIIQDQLAKLERGIVATPKTSEDLHAFAKANQGSMDIVLMQMAIQYGAKIALENVQEVLGK